MDIAEVCVGGFHNAVGEFQEVWGDFEDSKEFPEIGKAARGSGGVELIGVKFYFFLQGARNPETKCASFD